MINPTFEQDELDFLKYVETLREDEVSTRAIQKVIRFARRVYTDYARLAVPYEVPIAIPAELDLGPNYAGVGLVHFYRIRFDPITRTATLLED